MVKSKNVDIHILWLSHCYWGCKCWVSNSTHMSNFYPLEAVGRDSEVQLNPYSAGIDFSRQNLTSADVRF